MAGGSDVANNFSNHVVRNNRRNITKPPEIKKIRTLFERCRNQYVRIEVNAQAKQIRHSAPLATIRIAGASNVPANRTATAVYPGGSAPGPLSSSDRHPVPICAGGFYPILPSSSN